MNIFLYCQKELKRHESSFFFGFVSCGLNLIKRFQTKQKRNKMTGKTNSWVYLYWKMNYRKVKVEREKKEYCLDPFSLVSFQLATGQCHSWA